MSTIHEIELFLVEMPLVRPFRVSFGISTGKQCVLARVRTDDAEGWGECVADDGYPGFSGEWNEGVWTLLRDVLGPALLAADDVSILVVEQFAHEVLDVADVAAIILHGRVQFEGAPAEVADALHDAYLGGAVST